MSRSIKEQPPEQWERRTRKGRRKDRETGEEGERETARRGVLTSELHFYRLRHKRRMGERKKDGRREVGRWDSKTIT